MSWNLSVKNGTGILELDEPNTEVNVLTTENLTELKSILTDLPERSEIKALLITSAKKRIFIAGADIKEIRGISNEKDAYEKAEQGKAVFQILEDLKIPTITVINGPCLGGGYELALATDLCVSGSSDSIKIGLPEVNLGILPGFGGSIRLPRRVGLLKALPLILGGKMVSPQEALRNGMIDQIFPDVSLKDDAFQMAQGAASQGLSKFKKSRKQNFMTWFLQDTPPGRAVVLGKAKEGVLKKTKGQYPAPLKIIELIAKTYGKRSEGAYQEESREFSKLGATEISKNLIKLFFLSERYKKKKWTRAEIKPAPVRKCGVVGAGVMGGGIAQRVSYKNIPVRVKDINEKALGGALKEAHSIYQGALKRRRVTRFEMERKMNLISVGLTPAGFKRCDLVIEAVVEDLGIKRKVFSELDQITGQNAILASNTSSLPVTKMAEVVKRKERVVGIHFFNPVHRMPLVEIIRAEQTSDETVERAVQFARDLGKTVIVVQDSPGFLVNRLLMPYLNEAAFLLQDGLPSEEIDRIATDFGMPMGPVELIDQVGVDVGYKVAHVLAEAFGKRMSVAPILEKVHSRGFLGKKSGKGFYVYQGKKKTVNLEIPRDGIAQSKGKVTEEDAGKRMIYIMINEAARCLEEGIIDEAATVDIGMIMGTGFPPFRGGLLHYADRVGLSSIISDLRAFQKTLSAERFEPSSYLVSLADKNQSFYEQASKQLVS